MIVAVITLGARAPAAPPHPRGEVQEVQVRPETTIRAAMDQIETRLLQFHDAKLIAGVQELSPTASAPAAPAAAPGTARPMAP